MAPFLTQFACRQSYLQHKLHDCQNDYDQTNKINNAPHGSSFQYFIVDETSQVRGWFQIKLNLFHADEGFCTTSSSRSSNNSAKIVSTMPAPIITGGRSLPNAASHPRTQLGTK